MNKLDVKIINLLLENSRLSYRKISRKLGVSVATVMNRVKKMENEKIIKSYTAVIDYEKLGHEFKTIIDVRVLKGKLFNVEKKISSHPNVSAVYDTTGPFDALIIASFRTRRELDFFLKKIQTYDFVERIETRLVLNTIKDTQIVLN